MSWTRRVIWLVTLCSFLFANITVSQARPLAGSELGSLPADGRLKVGTNIRMKLHSDEILVGKILQISEAELVINTLDSHGYKARTVKREDVEWLVIMPSSGTDGVLVFLVVGVVVSYFLITRALGSSLSGIGHQSD